MKISQLTKLETEAKKILDELEAAAAELMWQQYERRQYLLSETWEWASPYLKAGASTTG